MAQKVWPPLFKRLHSSVTGSRRIHLWTRRKQTSSLHAIPHLDNYHRFGHIGRQLLYAVQRLVEWASDRHIIQHLTPIREDFLRMLLASSYFRDLQWKTQVLDLAMKMGAYSDPYLRAHMDLRMQIVYGRKICGPYLGVDSANVCANMMTAQKSIRSANDCLLVSEFARATRLLSRVEAPLSDKKDLAKFELCVLQQSQCTRARIECFLNRPQSAIDLVSSLKPDSGPAALLFDCDQTIIIARARCQLGHTDDAINLLREELNAQSELRRQNLHRVGKLKTLLGEMYTLQGDRKRAEDCFQEFPDNRFQEHPDSGSLTTNARVIARITQFQAVICRAILAHKACCWPEARQRWVQVRSLLQKYQWSSNFLHAIVQISLARVAQVCPSPDTYQQGGVYTAENTRDQIFDDRHVFVVLSHWFDEIRR